jgi:hypothetical protein
MTILRPLRRWRQSREIARPERAQRVCPRVSRARPAALLAATSPCFAEPSASVLPSRSASTLWKRRKNYPQHSHNY